MKGGIVEEAIYGYKKGLDERISDCKLAMHANCFDKMQKSMIHDNSSSHNGNRKRLALSPFNKLKSYCHHSLRDLCIQTDGAL